MNRLFLRDDDNDGGKELLNLLQDPFHGQLAAASLYSALAISLGVTTFITICFSFLRPYNQAIYAPKLKHADEKHAPPPIGKMPWAWVTPVIKTDEATIAQQIGMDATIFLRFVRMLRNIFLILVVLGIGILVPVYSKFSQKEVGGVATEWYVQITPRDVKEEPQWAQVVFAYLSNFVVVGFLWWNYRKVLQLRRMYFDSDEYQNSLHARTLMLFDLPKQGRSDEGIARIIDEVVPDSSFARTVVARNVKDLPELIHQHSRAVRKLEEILAKYLKNPDQLPERPLCKPAKKDRAFDTYARGQKIDAIDYYTKRIRDLEVEIKEVRAGVDKRGTMPYGFASYTDIVEAHNIAFACRKKKLHGATVQLAPRPNDIIWRNMPLSRASRSRRRWINSLWVALLTLLWVAPNAMIAIFLVNLTNLGKVWPAFNRSLKESPTLWGIVQGIASPALMSLVYLVLPIIFRRLSIKAGDQTKTGREHHVIARMFGFFIFNNLIVFSFFSTVWTFIAGVVKETNETKDAWKAIVNGNIADAVFQAFCNNSPFWVTYLLQRQLGAAVDLAQLWPVIYAFFLKKFSSPTPRELIELSAPEPFDYASYYNYFLFYTTVTFCFMGIQPLTLVATAMYFCIDSYLKKYLIMYRFVTKTESGGVFWRILFNRLIFGTILGNLVVLLTCWARGSGRLHFYCVCPLPVILIVFKIYCRSVFDDKIQYYSTRRVGRNADQGLPQKENRRRSEKLASRFGHPALYKPLITPMVHSKAQNLLPSIYHGRLTDGREVNASDLMSVSGYSDMYALDAMQGGKPGKSAGNNVPGFEYVSEAHMDFEFYKNRAEFTDQHGGGEMYGRGSDITRSGTPASFDDYSDRSLSRPLSQGSTSTAYFAGAGPARRVMPNKPSMSSMSNVTNMSDMTDVPIMPALPGAAETGYHGPRERSPMYAQDNGSSSALMRNPAGMSMVPLNPPASMTPPPSYQRDIATDRGRMASRQHAHPASISPGPSVGALGGGPQGYSGLAQAEDLDQHGHNHNQGTADPAQYNYYRGDRVGGGQPVQQAPGQGQGWQGQGQGHGHGWQGQGQDQGQGWQGQGQGHSQGQGQGWQGHGQAW